MCAAIRTYKHALISQPGHGPTYLAGHDSETGPTAYLSTEPVSRKLAITLALCTLLRCIMGGDQCQNYTVVPSLN